MTPLERELLAALIEMRNACAAALRVLVKLDEQFFQRFIDELKVAGVKDGFGKRTDDLIQKAQHTDVLQ